LDSEESKQNKKVTGQHKMGAGKHGDCSQFTRLKARLEEKVGSGMLSTSWHIALIFLVSFVYFSRNFA